MIEAGNSRGEPATHLDRSTLPSPYIQWGPTFGGGLVAAQVHQAAVGPECPTTGLQATRCLRRQELPAAEKPNLIGQAVEFADSQDALRLASRVLGEAVVCLQFPKQVTLERHPLSERNTTPKARYCLRIVAF